MAKARKRGTAEIPPARLEKFLAALADAQTITAACKLALVGRSTIYENREADPGFALRWDEALEAGTEKLEGEMVRRGVEGVLKPIYQGGKMVGKVREYSDTLLIFALKARRPDVYRERFDHRHSDPNGNPLVQPVLNVTITKRGAA